jgi:ornithine cyclodeaminase/alanine dehydrogenase-like protein (mu-crystallin family)
MRFISAAEVDAALDFAGLVETLREAFRAGAIQPVRHHHTIERPEGTPSTLLLMPAWSDFSQGGEGFVGVKVVSVSPDNNLVGKPAVMGGYMLLDGRTCEPRAIIDGQRLTLWRTAAASALASTYLSRTDSEKLLVIGAGALSPFLARAHAAVRPIAKVRIWNRSPQNAEKVAAELRESGMDAQAHSDLDACVAWADIVTSATISTVPLVRGAALRPGTHVDLVGAFSPAMRESDEAAVSMSRVYVDTRAGALKEAGDIVQSIAEGALRPQDIRGDLYDLARGTGRGRDAAGEITLFKSVGAAIEDLAAGIAVWKAVGG